MWRSIELREIRVFLTLAEELHFGRTAEQLGLTQSRVSQSLRALETRLGERLVDRTSRRVALTRAGVRLRAELQPAYKELADVLQRAAAESAPVEGVLRLGVTAAAALSPQLVHVIEVFERSYPECKVQAVELPFLERHAPLRHGDVDLMVTRLPLEQPDLVVGPLVARESRVLAVARDHALASRTSVSVEDLADYAVADFRGFGPKEIGTAFVPETTPSGRVIRRLRVTVGDFADLVLLIARGKVVHPTVTSAIPRFSHPEIVCVPIADMPDSMTALAWRRRSANPRLEAFVRVSQEVLASRPSGSVQNRRLRT